MASEQDIRDLINQTITSALGNVVSELDQRRVYEEMGQLDGLRLNAQAEATLAAKTQQRSPDNTSAFIKKQGVGDLATEVVDIFRDWAVLNSGTYDRTNSDAAVATFNAIGRPSPADMNAMMQVVLDDLVASIPSLVIQPTLATPNGVVNGVDTGTLSNAGTWEGQGVISIVADVGVVSVNTDGTWNWNKTATMADDGTTVTLTITDDIGSGQLQFNLTVVAAPSLTVDQGSVVGTVGQRATNSGTWAHSGNAGAVGLSASVGSVVKNSNGTWDWEYTSQSVESLTVTITSSDGDWLVSQQFGFSSTGSGTTQPLAVTLTHQAAVLPSQQRFTVAYSSEPELTFEKFTVMAGAQMTEFPANNGRVLDLGPWAGQTVTVTVTVQGRSPLGDWLGSDSVSVAVPAWAAVLRLDDTLTPGGNDFNTWSSAIAAIAAASAGTVLQIYPHSSGKWTMSSSDYLNLSGASDVAIEGFGLPGSVVVDGDADNASAGNKTLLRVVNGQRVTLSNLTFEKCLFGAIAVTGTSSEITFRDVLITGSYGRSAYVSTTGSQIQWIGCTSRDAIQEPIAFDTGADRDGVGMWILESAGTDMINCQVIDCNEATADGIRISGANVVNTRLLHTMVSGSARQGVLVLNGPDKTVIDGCSSIGNGATGYQIECSEIVATGSGVLRNSVAANNSAIGSTEAGVWIDGQAGLVTDNWLVENCEFYGNAIGILVGEQASNVVVRGNYVHDNQAQQSSTQDKSSWGLWIYNDVSNAVFYNNTVVRNGKIDSDRSAASTNGSGIYAWQTAGSSDIRAINNLVSDNVLNSAGGNDANQIMFPSGDGAVVEWDYNLYWNEPRTNGYANSAGGPFWDFDNWKTNTVWDVSTIRQDPNLDGGDKPQMGSPALGNGRHQTTITAVANGSQFTVGYSGWFKEGDRIEINGSSHEIVAIAGNDITLSTPSSAAIGNVVWHYDRAAGANRNIGAF